MARRRALSTRVTVVIAVLALAGVAVGAGSAQAVRAEVRGFDGSTITVAGLGIKAQLPGAETGARARVKRFNDTNEIKGVKIEYAEFADDKQDPATALSEARRLVTQVGVFAIVGDVSTNNPGDFFNQQHVPYFGWGIDNTYCNPTPTTKLYAFGVYGCGAASQPSYMYDAGTTTYAYVKKQTGKDHPTVALISSDTQTGHTVTKLWSIAFKGVGFKVVYAKGAVPPPPVSDYTPYIQAVLTSDGGHAPDAFVCMLAVDCIPMYGLARANGFTGTFWTGLYSNILTKPLNGSVAGVTFQNLDGTTPGVAQLKKDVEAVKPGYAIDSGTVAGYASTDMFIQALEKVAKKGKSNITPENVQKAAATQTWQIKGLAGPTKFPDSVVSPSPYCSQLLLSNGSAWVQVEPYQCSSKRFPVK